jgi:hypothetical protein
MPNWGDHSTRGGIFLALGFLDNRGCVMETYPRA